MTTIALSVTGVLGALYLVVLVSGTVYSRLFRKPEAATVPVEREPGITPGG